MRAMLDLWTGFYIAVKYERPLVGALVVFALAAFSSSRPSPENARD